MDLNQLRLALTPSLKFKKAEKIPKSVLSAFEGIVDRLLKKQTDK